MSLNPGYYAIYDGTGRIWQTMVCAEGERLYQAGVGQDVVSVGASVNDARHYVAFAPVRVVAKTDLGLVPDKTQINADGLDISTITGVPAGVSVTWPDGITDEVTDGLVEFAVDLPGTYTLTLRGVPYLDQEVIIEAVAAA